MAYVVSPGLMLLLDIVVSADEQGMQASATSGVVHTGKNTKKIHTAANTDQKRTKKVV